MRRRAGLLAKKQASPSANRPAWYFDRPPSPIHRPARSQVAQGDGGSAAGNRLRATTSAAARRQNNRGPSGTTKVPADTVKNAERFSARTDHTPASAPNSRRVRQNSSQDEPANRRMKGSRIACPSPSTAENAYTIQDCAGGWS